MSLGSFSLPYGRNHFHILFRSFRGPKGPAYGGERGTEEGMIGSERNWHAIPRVKRRQEREPDGRAGDSYGGWVGWAGRWRQNEGRNGSRHDRRSLGSLLRSVGFRTVSLSHPLPSPSGREAGNPALRANLTDHG